MKKILDYILMHKYLAGIASIATVFSLFLATNLKPSSNTINISIDNNTGQTSVKNKMPSERFTPPSQTTVSTELPLNATTKSFTLKENSLQKACDNEFNIIYKGLIKNDKKGIVIYINNESSRWIYPGETITKESRVMEILLTYAEFNESIKKPYFNYKCKSFID